MEALNNYLLPLTANRCAHADCEEQAHFELKGVRLCYDHFSIYDVVAELASLNTKLAETMANIETFCRQLASKRERVVELERQLTQTQKPKRCACADCIATAHFELKGVWFCSDHFPIDQAAAELANLNTRLDGAEKARVAELERRRAEAVTAAATPDGRTVISDAGHISNLENVITASIVPDCDRAQFVVRLASLSRDGTTIKIEALIVARPNDD